MSSQRVLGLMVCVLALMHVYLIYPMPGAKIASIVSSELAKAETAGGARSASNGSVVVTESEVRERLGLDALERSMWRSWLLGVAVVLGGVVAGLFAAMARPPVGSAVGLVFSLACIGVYWLEEFLPMEMSIADFVAFQLSGIQSLIRREQFGGLFPAVHRIVAPIAFSALAVCFLVSFRRKRE